MFDDRKFEKRLTVKHKLDERTISLGSTKNDNSRAPIVCIIWSLGFVVCLCDSFVCCSFGQSIVFKPRYWSTKPLVMPQLETIVDGKI